MAEDMLATTDLAAAGLREDQIARLVALIERHVAEGRYPGAQIAIARHGALALFRTFGNATAERAAADDTLWLLYSNTKVVTAAACWVLAEQGAFSFTDRVADHVPEFATRGKDAITVMQVITHQAGYPHAQLPVDCWEDVARRRAAVCDFSLEFTPGSRVHYHGQSAHWTLAMLIEAVTGEDFREVIRTRLIEKLGLQRELFVGLPRDAFPRAADMHEPNTEEGGAAVPIAANNAISWRRAGSPGAGGYATARAMAAFYQMMLNGGALGGQQVVSPRGLAYAIRNWTGDRVDTYNGMPMHRGLGPHLRGSTPGIRGLGSLASPATFGHGGVGSSYCWGDPESGVSFAYLTNCRIPDPWHSQRMEAVSNLVHSAIL